LRRSIICSLGGRYGMFNQNAGIVEKRPYMRDALECWNSTAVMFVIVVSTQDFMKLVRINKTMEVIKKTIEAYHYVCTLSISSKNIFKCKGIVRFKFQPEIITWKRNLLINSKAEEFHALSLILVIFMHSL